MNVLAKIEEIKALIAQKEDLEAFKEQHNQLKNIEARYAFSSSLMNVEISADPNDIQQLDYIKSSISATNPSIIPLDTTITTNTNTNPDRSDFVIDNPIEKSVLKDLIKRKIQGLSRLPNYIQHNFNNNSYNNFVNGKSRDILKGLQEYTIDELNDIIFELDNKRLEFLNEPMRTKYKEALSLLSKSQTNSYLSDTFINKIKALEITSEELDYIFEKYNIHDKTPTTLDEKDIAILLQVKKAPFILTNVAELMGLTQDECDILIKNIELDQKKKENLLKLTKPIILPSKYIGALN